MYIATAVLIAQMAFPAAAVAARAGQQGQSATVPDQTISGLVLDASGRVVPGAMVIVQPASGAARQSVTGPDGRFTVDAPGTPGAELIVRAGGFAESRQTLQSAAGQGTMEIVLSPAGVSETVTVTATRGEQRTGDLPASVSVLTRDDIRQSPAVVADDVLREVPTFSLFRRTSSLSSHPTAQGVSLRGIGPSGVSRTLVLLDGVPFNDPFGGWVYWTRVPLESLDRIEVVDTASSSLYGNYAMGGVINLLSAPPARRSVEVRTQYGNRNSPKVDVSASDVWGKLGMSVNGSAFSTDGYPIVAAAERGAVDNKAAVDFQNFNVKLQYDPTARVQTTFRAGYFHEARDNGKASTIDGAEEANSTKWTTLSGGAKVLLPDSSTLQVTLFGDVETFRSNFLAVPPSTPPRSFGRMSLTQRVPSTSAGGTGQWSRGLGGRNFLTVGSDWRWVDGDSEENGLDAQTGTRVTLRRISGGTQRSIGFFAQDLWSPLPRLMVTLSARVDSWRNYDGHNLETTVPSGTPTENNDPSLPDREDTVLSPRVAAKYHLTDKVSVWGDVGSGFRAPTLNELYRQFRVGNVLTLANNQLGPERLVGGELGIDVQPVRQLTLRATWYDNHVEDAVSNVTIDTSGSPVVQQRQNLGRTKITGLQTDVDYRFHENWRVSGGYLFNSAKVAEYDAEPDLVGNYLAQVPRHRGSVQVEYTHPQYLNIALAVQAIGRQFDDDQNIRTVPGHSSPGLPGYALVSLQASRRLTGNVEVFAGVQNLTNNEYFVGTLPTTIGTPRLVNGGIRIRFAGAN